MYPIIRYPIPNPKMAIGMTLRSGRIILPFEQQEDLYRKPFKHYYETVNTREYISIYNVVKLIVYTLYMAVFTEYVSNLLYSYYMCGLFDGIVKYKENVLLSSYSPFDRFQVIPANLYCSYIVEPYTDEVYLGNAIMTALAVRIIYDFTTTFIL